MADEPAYPAALFAEAFANATEAGLAWLPRARELAGPESVADAIDLLGARRLLHGVRAIEDGGLVRRLAESGVCLDVCPTSNVLLSIVSSIAGIRFPRCPPQESRARSTRARRFSSTRPLSASTRAAEAISGSATFSLHRRLRVACGVVRTEEPRATRMRRDRAAGRSEISCADRSGS
jgi:hypothetical protein